MALPTVKVFLDWRFSLLQVLAPAVFIAVIVFGLTRSAQPLWVMAILLLFGCLFAWVMFKGLQALVRPPLLLEITPTHLLSYWRDGRYQSTPVAIQWQDLAEIQLEHHRASAMTPGAGTTRIGLLVLRFRNYSLGYPPERLSLLKGPDPSAVYLNAHIGQLKGPALLQTLQNAWGRAQTQS